LAPSNTSTQAFAVIPRFDHPAGVSINDAAYAVATSCVPYCQIGFFGGGSDGGAGPFEGCSTSEYAGIQTVSYCQDTFNEGQDWTDIKNCDGYQAQIVPMDASGTSYIDVWDKNIGQTVANFAVTNCQDATVGGQCVMMGGGCDVVQTV
jgi:hypothetical protein